MPTPSQVDIIVSEDPSASSPIMYNRIFTWVETRAKSELRMRLVPLNKADNLSNAKPAVQQRHLGD